jgi:hypothetical protein
VAAGLFYGFNVSAVRSSARLRGAGGQLVDEYHVLRTVMFELTETAVDGATATER